ncbi:MAG: NADH dehydrogenase [Acidobacteria bacterium 13_1_40CM_2_68_5]|nr:MAG: NADH dehydrogenase [Acidobacteria bacterium 13_1_40CM_2_68_5]OLE67729.1 MAG: NADH dehydrogenase [Acidobacteria bacterium 13_1_20CM_2_68_7]
MENLPSQGSPSMRPVPAETEDALHGETMVVNMGPSHPSTHGVLRLVLRLDGEVVKAVQPHLGYLHRGMEKIAEGMTYNQFVPYTDRLDYLAPLSNNVGYILAVEKLLGITVPPRAQVIRVMCCEIARISAHLLWLGTGALDLGAATVFFHTFRERETLYNIIEALTGTRLTTSYTRVGGLMRDLPEGWTGQVRSFIEAFPAMLDEIDSLLTRNRIWMKRTQGVGRIGAAEAIALGLTGPNLRGCGIAYDVRRTEPYSGYEAYEFEVPVGSQGDAYDRYLVRLEEMRQSARILDQALRRLPEGRIAVDDPKITLPDKTRVLTSMEELIEQFMLVTEGIKGPPGEVYHAIEAPKGELGFYIKSEGDKSPYRLQIRSPSFISLQAIETMAVGGLLSDLIAVIASLDPVMGEVDR